MSETDPGESVGFSSTILCANGLKSGMSSCLLLAAACVALDSDT